jgi:hypothetical protein
VGKTVFIQELIVSCPSGLSSSRCFAPLTTRAAGRTTLRRLMVASPSSPESGSGPARATTSTTRCSRQRSSTWTETPRLPSCLAR